MNSKRIFTLSGRGGASGHCSVLPCGAVCEVVFSVRGLPPGRYSCLCGEERTLCGYLNGGKGILRTRVPVSAEKPFFEVTDKNGICMLSSGSPVRQSFYEKNRAHYERLFRANRPVPELSELLPSSKWAEVHSSRGEYVAGIIYDEDGVPLYLCCGVRGQGDQCPPEDIRGYCQWLPCGDSGWWVVYQSAETGATLRF